MGGGPICAHASSAALNFHSDCVHHNSAQLRLGTEVVSIARIQRGPSEAARWASTETTSVPDPTPHCQPVTSYPFSCKHRLTKFV